MWTIRSEYKLLLLMSPVYFSYYSPNKYRQDNSLNNTKLINFHIKQMKAWYKITGMDSGGRLHGGCIFTLCFQFLKALKFGN